MKVVKRIFVGVLVFLLAMAVGLTVSAEVLADDVAKIGETGYATLAEAVAAANGEFSRKTANFSPGYAFTI